MSASHRNNVFHLLVVSPVPEKCKRSEHKFGGSTSSACPGAMPAGIMRDRESYKYMEDRVKTTRLILALLLMTGLTGFSQVIQTVTIETKPMTEDDIKLIRQNIQAIKDDVIRDTMQFTEPEKAAFWPVYKTYSEEQHAIASKRLAVILDYAKHIDTMTDADASNLSQRMLQIEDDTQSLRKKYLPKFEAAIGAKRAAKFYQVDNRLTLIVNVQLASEIPLIP
jgi:hypothetical protein